MSDDPHHPEATRLRPLSVKAELAEAVEALGIDPTQIAERALRRTVDVARAAAGSGKDEDKHPAAWMRFD